MIDIAVAFVHGIEEVVNLTFDGYVGAAFELLRRQKVLHIQIRHRVCPECCVRIFVIG